MEAMNHILFLFMMLGVNWCHSDNCETGCAPKWDFPEPDKGSVDLLQGDDFQFRCNAHGKPSPVVTWSKGGKTLVVANLETNVTIANGSLHIPDVYPVDSGAYTCSVENNLGFLEWSIYLTVYEKGSEEIDGPKNTSTTVNQTVVLWCHVDTGDGNATVTWLKEITDVSGTSMTTVKHGAFKTYDQLVFPRVRLSDAGCYSCLVNTTLTSVRRSAWLTVITNTEEAGISTGSTPPPTAFIQYLEGIAISVGTIFGVFLGVMLLVSGVALYRNRRRLHASNRGTSRLRLREDSIGESALDL